MTSTDPGTLTARGVAIPKLGFGTWQLSGRACVEAVRDALEIGYRHIDTARMYGNEQEVGRALAESGLARGEYFLTTKISPSDFEPAALRAAAEASVRALGTGHVDLLLLHWPNPRVALERTLAALEEVREAGLAREVGVSNFPAAMLRRALELAPVVADQVEFHPYVGQAPLLALAEAEDLMLTAYSPLAQGRVARDPTLAEIGEAHGKSAGQVALRWLLDHPQVSAIPKAAGHGRRVENFAIGDFALTPGERARIDALGPAGD